LEEKLIYKNELGKSLEISHSSVFFLQKVEGLGAIKNIIYTQKSPNQDGVTVTKDSLDLRDITIEGSINSTDREKVLAHRRILLQTFNPKLKGRLEYQLGEFKKEIDCKVEYAPILPHTDSKFKKFQIQLYCPNPFFKDTVESKEEIAIWRGSLEFPLELTEVGIETGYRESSLIVNIFNAGDVECGIKIQFKALATVANPSIVNVDTMEYFKINKTMEAGEIITVTTHFQNKRVELYKNGVVSNAFNWIDLESTFLQLDVGDNLLRYNADEGIDNLEVSIWHTPQYLGV